MYSFDEEYIVKLDTDKQFVKESHEKNNLK